MCQAFPRNGETVLSCFALLSSYTGGNRPPAATNAALEIEPSEADENALTRVRPHLNLQEHPPVLKSQ